MTKTKKTDSLYISTGWRKLRESLAKKPCAVCRKVWENSFNLDHKIPRKAGGSDSPGNLQWLCASCHSRKTARHDGGFGNKPKQYTIPDCSGLPTNANHFWNKTLKN